MKPKYKRILLKLSGEVLAGEQGHGFDFSVISTITDIVAKCAEAGTQIGIVVGGGNFWRGRSSGSMNRTKADHIGMLATVMNSICLCDTLCQAGVKSKVLSSVEMSPIAQQYSFDLAEKYLCEGYVVIFGGGTGSPYFSTDTAASLRAVEIGADVLLKATNVDGVYNKDPHKFDDAVKFDTLSHEEIVAKGYGVMDSTAAAMCKDNNLPVLVFNLTDPKNIIRAVSGENVGTLIIN